MIGKMKLAKFAAIGAVALLVGTVLQYTLPKYDIVEVVGTENRRIDFGENSFFWASADSGSDAGRKDRDVFFIQTRLQNGSPMVYRNEDTGWGWPFYFKFDSSNLQAEAAAAAKHSDGKWFAVTHYGWRVKWLTIFPNAISIREVAGPDVFIFPFAKAVILTFLAGVGAMAYVTMRRIKRRIFGTGRAEAPDAAPATPNGAD